jgi:hypothetical protein
MKAASACSTADARRKLTDEKQQGNKKTERRKTD